MRKWPHANHREAGLPFATRSDVMAQNGTAATSHPLATQIAIDILKKMAPLLMQPLLPMLRLA